MEHVTTDGWVHIQHQGSKLCADIKCPACGEQEHWDDEFMFSIRCPHCGVTLVVGDTLTVKVRTDDDWQSGDPRVNLDAESKVEIDRFISGDRP